MMKKTMPAAKLLLACVLACLVLARCDMCPREAEYNGCVASGCISLPNTTRRTPIIVCDNCGVGYVLVNQGTRNARCDCAPGWAGQGNNGVCKKCPADTQVALGGSKRTSACLNCPADTIYSADLKDCVCPAGSYRAAASVAAGWKPVTCKACTAVNAYVAMDNNMLSACSTCTAPQVANKAHTLCVDPSNPDAVTGALGAIISNVTTTITNITSTAVQGASNELASMIARFNDMVAAFNQKVSSINPTDPSGAFSSDGGAAQDPLIIGDLTAEQWTGVAAAPVLSDPPAQPE